MKRFDDKSEFEAAVKKVKTEIDELNRILKIDESQIQEAKAKRNNTRELLSKKNTEHSKLIDLTTFNFAPFPSTSEWDERQPNCYPICAFNVDFSICVGPIGEIDEYTGEYEVSVINNPIEGIDDDEILALYPDSDEWDITHLEDIDCSSRYGSWRESRDIYLYEYVFDYSGYKDLSVDMLPSTFYRWHEENVENYDIDGFFFQAFSITIVDKNDRKPNECVIHANLSKNTININSSMVYLSILDYTSEAYERLFECQCTCGDLNMKKFILSTLNRCVDTKFYKYIKI